MQTDPTKNPPEDPPNSLSSEGSAVHVKSQSPPLEPNLDDMDFTEDGDVIERIRSRASMTSDIQVLRSLREKYKEGFFRLDLSDPRDPLNWSLASRLSHQILYGVSVLLSFFSASIFAPLADVVTPHGTEIGNLAFGVFLIGSALGPLIFTPFCSMFGRLVAIYTPLFVTGVLMCILANLDYTGAIVVYRFLAGVLAAGPVCGLRGASADIWLTPTSKGKAHEIAVQWHSLCALLGSTAGPVFGALLVQTNNYGWRWSCWLSGLLAISVSFACLLFLKETYHPIIEQKAAKDKRLATGFWGLHSEHDSYEFRIPHWGEISHDLKVLVQPISVCTTLFTGFNYGVLYFLVTGAPHELQARQNLSFAGSYATLLAIPIGLLLAGWVNVWLAKPRRTREWILRMHPSSSGVSEVHSVPESQLRAVAVLGWLLPAGAFMCGWSIYKNVHWIVAVIGMALVGAGISINVRGCHFYVHDVYPGYFQLTSSACISMQCVFAGIFPLFSRQLLHQLNPHWGFSLIAFISLALWALMCVLVVFGPQIRRFDPFSTNS